MLVVLGLGLLLLAGLFVLMGALPVRARRRQREQLTVPPGWVPAPGIVRSERTTFIGEHRGVLVRQPLVEFRDARGQVHTFLSQVRGTLMPTPGTPVRVFHHPLDPTRARLDPALVPQEGRTDGSAAVVLLGCLLVPIVLVLVVGAIAALTAAAR